MKTLRHILGITPVVLGCWVGGALNVRAETNSASIVSQPRTFTSGFVKPKAGNLQFKQTSAGTPVTASAAKGKLLPARNDSNLRKPVSRTLSGSTKTRNPTPQRTSKLDSEIPRQAMDHIAAIQQAHLTTVLERNRAEDLREELRDQLRVNRDTFVQNQRETMIDARQRAEQLQSKLIEQKELLEATALTAKGRNRRGTD